MFFFLYYFLFVFLFLIFSGNGFLFLLLLLIFSFFLFPLVQLFFLPFSSISCLLFLFFLFPLLFLFLPLLSSFFLYFFSFLFFFFPLLLLISSIFLLPLLLLYFFLPCFLYTQFIFLLLVSFFFSSQLTVSLFPFTYNSRFLYFSQCSPSPCPARVTRPGFCSADSWRECSCGDKNHGCASSAPTLAILEHTHAMLSERVACAGRGSGRYQACVSECACPDCQGE